MRMRYKPRFLDRALNDSTEWKNKMDEVVSEALVDCDYDTLGDFFNKELYKFFDLQDFSIEDTVSVMRGILNTVYPNIRAKTNYHDKTDDYESDPAANSTAYFPDVQWDEITVADLIRNPYIDSTTIEDAICEIAEFYHYSDYYDMRKWQFKGKSDMERSKGRYKHKND